MIGSPNFSAAELSLKVVAKSVTDFVQAMTSGVPVVDTRSELESDVGYIIAI